MSSDVTYQVSVEFAFLQKNASAMGGFASKIGEVDRKLVGLGNGFARSFGDAVDSVGGALVDTLTNAAKYGGAALGTGLALATKTGLEFNATLENSAISLATIQDMQLGTGLEKGMQGAQRAMAAARKDAAALPGELKDLVGIMQTVAPAALTRGIDMTRLEKMSANAMAAAAAMGVPFHVAARQLGATLEGRATSAMAFPMRLGIDRHSLKSMTGMQRADAVDAALGKAAPSIALWQASWAGLTSTAKDTGRQLAGVMTQPLFGSIKGELGRGLDWFAANEDKANAWAMTLGVGLDRALHMGLDRIRLWGPAVLTFGHTLSESLTAAFAKVEPYLKRFEGVALRFMNDPNAAHMLGGAGIGLIGAKTASSAMIGGGNLLGDLAKFGPFLSSAGIGLGEMAAISGVAIPALAALGAGAYGATDILLDGTNRWHDGAMASIAEIEKNASNLAKAGEAAAPYARSVADAYGAYLIKGLEFWSGLADEMVIDIRSHIGPLASALDALTTTLNPTTYKYDPAWQYSPVAPRSFDFAGADGSASGSALKVPSHVTNITQHISIPVTSNQDPGRIAKQVRREFQEAARNPTGVMTPTSGYYR